MSGNRMTGDTILGLRKIRKGFHPASEEIRILEAAIEELVSLRVQKTFDDDRIRRLIEASVKDGSKDKTNVRCQVE